MAKRQVLKVPGLGHGNQPIPYGVKIGNMVFSGGISGQDPATGAISPEPARQAELIFQNIRALLAQAGGETDDIAHMTVFVKDNQYRDAINVEWLKMFPDEENRPTRHTLTADLRGAALMQCELIAVLG
ncbi:MAG: RidA family protein [Dehalococcoidia bacterium]